MEPVSASQLRNAARVADALVFTVGIAGAVAGGLLLRRGELAFALVAWGLTFVAGAALRLLVWLARGMADVLERSRRMADDLAELQRDRVAGERRSAGSGWH
ncbi:MAG: hypothetical protein M3O86_03090 [Actinomycetota bacterium]|nr:hypothetical protein [Actinomycetota bacterium]